LTKDTFAAKIIACFLKGIGYDFDWPSLLAGKELYEKHPELFDGY
jgi:hypothetical protein